MKTQILVGKDTTRENLGRVDTETYQILVDGKLTVSSEYPSECIDRDEQFRSDLVLAIATSLYDRGIKKGEYEIVNGVRVTNKKPLERIQVSQVTQDRMRELRVGMEFMLEVRAYRAALKAEGAGV